MFTFLIDAAAGLRAIRVRASPAILGAIAALLVALAPVAPTLAQSSQPRTVTFLSADGKTTLTGYLFAPSGRPKVAPAVVLLHGRQGAYIARAKGNYSSVTLARDLRSWANLWAAQGYWALVVDSYGPRGFAAGLDSERAETVDETAMRRLDAYGALRYLSASPRVRADRIGLEGWSSGATAVLAAMDVTALSSAQIRGDHTYRAAIAIEPDCGKVATRRPRYKPYARTDIFMAGRSGETAIAACQAMAATAKAAGSDLPVTVFAGASTSFEANGREHPAAANAAAVADLRRRSQRLMAAALDH